MEDYSGKTWQEIIRAGKDAETSQAQKDYGYKSIDDVYDKFAPKNQVEREIITLCSQLSELLISKNRAYGNSALEPNRIFAKSDSIEQLKVRIDDKLNRIMKGSEFPGEDTVDDLLGYLVLLKIAIRDNWR